MKENDIKIIAGGQTGADRGAVDAAIDSGVHYYGWVPSGRLDESGVIPDRYKNFRETFSSEYLVRTKFNIIESDATIFLFHNEIIKGTNDALFFVQTLGAPFIKIDFGMMNIQSAGTRLYEWSKSNNFLRLNIAGARASDDNEIYIKTYLTMKLFLKFNGEI